ncbi:FAD:protein FMN transferase [uncultured Ruminococcus sp.]|uniref:FAD:protein FMN transferase n=1 Tax=uncultured Ruminococcus sp. TaxID=165186 RepID=UPI0025CF49DA|nr:FAD:protein FMN transferase [uncultured Ruminococcus sp.]
MKKPERRLLISAACAAALMVCGAVMMHLDKKPDEATFFAMDCPCTVAVYGGDAEAVKDRIKALEKLYSPYEKGSEIARLNENGRLELSEETAQLVKESVELTKKYGGADISAGAVTELWNVTGDEPRVPGEEEIKKALSAVEYENISFSGQECVLENGAKIDVGCDGKGFALDEVKKLLDSEKADCGVVSFGSSTLLYGEKPDKTDFKVAVTDPFDNDNTCLSFTSDGGFVSTSGGYERFFEAQGKKWSHIFDLTTGYPCDTDLASVTVIGQSGIETDFLSTCIFIGGSKDIDRWLGNEDIEVIAIDENGVVYCSDSIKSRISISDDKFRFE